jgi:restriction endonuclease Mrr
MNVTADQLANLQMKLERRNLLFRKAARYVAELNTSGDMRSDAFQDRVNRNMVRAREALESTQGQIRVLLESASTSLLDKESSDSVIVQLMDAANDELLGFLANNPRYLHSLHARTFEELIARIFIDLGCSVELMKATHDGGKDIILRTESPAGPSIAYVQCKRTSPERPVGIDIVRQLHGVHMKDNVNQSLIVTTSRFTPTASDYAQDLAFLISLKEYADIVSWLKMYKGVRSQ